MGKIQLLWNVSNLHSIYDKSIINEDADASEIYGSYTGLVYLERHF